MTSWFDPHLLSLLVISFCFTCLTLPPPIFISDPSLSTFYLYKSSFPLSDLISILHPFTWLNLFIYLTYSLIFLHQPLPPLICFGLSSSYSHLLDSPLSSSWPFPNRNIFCPYLYSHPLPSLLPLFVLAILPSLHPPLSYLPLPSLFSLYFPRLQPHPSSSRLLSGVTPNTPTCLRLSHLVANLPRHLVSSNSFQA